MQRITKLDDEQQSKAQKELLIYRQLRAEAARLKERAERCREQCVYIKGIDYTLERVDSSRKSDLVDIFIKWADMEFEANSKAQEAERRLIEIDDKLSKLTITQKIVLESYYIKSMSITKIARVMQYSEVQVKRIKGNALTAYARLGEGGEL